MGISYHEASGEFHLYNKKISYIMKILPNGQLGQLYAGKRVPDRADYSYLLNPSVRPGVYQIRQGKPVLSLEHTHQEYPAYGTTDFRMPAIEIEQENGSRITDFVYSSHRIYCGKPKLPGLPATYTEQDEEAVTLEIHLKDALIQMELVLLYTIFEQEAVIARSARMINMGTQEQKITTAMSISLDLPDDDYEWVQFSGAWARERHIKTRKLQPGVTSVGSLRGASSAMHNPFVILKRPNTDEVQGEAFGFSLVYSGNFLAQAEVDTFGAVRLMMGIHPFGFAWNLKPGESFQTPEAVMAYSSAGLNRLSQTYHRLYRRRLARGYWRDRERPILLNNWEATYFDFTEEKLLEIAENAKKDGIELFVLDDGWFGARRNDTKGLGDWKANMEILPSGISGLSEKVEQLGLKFGLWFEPEMTNPDSDLFRDHPDWILNTPGRTPSQGRNQYVLDFSRKEVVDAVYKMMAEILRESRISYIKWDMNRYITECYSTAWDAKQQGEIFHRYILGVYDLYERLTSEFPEILFESCASGGGRFDPGLLYYAPQGWTSDDTDACERVKIQYGSSYVYPVSMMGTHVSITPNHQLGRITPLKTRAEVAYFGAFGYELDLTKLSEEERREVREQIRFVKRYRKLIHQGDFYRLQSPFDHSVSAWMVVSEDKKSAVVAGYRSLNDMNMEFLRFRLQGLAGAYQYSVLKDGKNMGCFSGDELMNIGLLAAAVCADEMPNPTLNRDFGSVLCVLEAE